MLQGEKYNDFLCTIIMQLGKKLFFSIYFINKQQKSLFTMIKNNYEIKQQIQ
uniref:Uncharacterized protein n=1 Tax=Anguilla anguilla TaxID=7936 RepID=A0A0E9PWY8_ANGAN